MAIGQEKQIKSRQMKRRKVKKRKGESADCSSSYLTDVGALGLGGPGDDARDGEAGLAGVDEVGRVHLTGQRLDVAQDGHLHLQVGRLRLIHDESHQDVELLLVREGLSAREQEAHQSLRDTEDGSNSSVSELLIMI